MGSEDFRYGMVKAKRFDLSKHYDIIQQWWINHGSFPPEPEHLAPIGVMVEVEGKPICAGFLYNTDSKICVFEFVVCDPFASKNNRSKGLRHLIKRIKNLAEELDYSLIYTSVGIQPYIKKLKEADFKEIDTNQTHMFYKIGR